MNEELVKALRLPEVVKRLQDRGMTIAGSTPEEFKAYVDGQIETWARVVKDNDIKAGS